MHTILDMTAVEVARGVREGDIKALDAAEAYLARIREVDPSVGAYLRVLEDDAREAARAVDDRRSRGEALGPLAGVPLALKDIFVTEGIETTCGSRITSPSTWASINSAIP